MSESLAAAAPFVIPAQREGINQWFIAITVTLATFMELLDTAIANVALPTLPVDSLSAMTKALGC